MNKMNKYGKLKELIERIDILIEKKVITGNQEFNNWYDDVIYFLNKNFGEESFEFKNFNNISFLLWFNYDLPDYEKIEQYKKGLLTSKNFLSKILEDIREGEIVQDKKENINYNNKKVFIVHGHNGELREKIARILSLLELEPIILSEQPNQGKTIIEKLEDYSNDVECAVCLFTADDLCQTKNDKQEYRARQNVVFETGYFIACLSRERIIIVKDKKVEIPSDLSGVVYNDTENLKFDILKELKKIGFDVDANKLV